MTDVSGMPGSLLIVDDDDGVAGTVARAFERLGWDTHRARTGSEAIAMARGSERYDAAIVDLVLPGKGGLDVVREVRARNAGARIVGITGLGAAGMEQAFRAAGADAFVGKPFDLADLVAAVRHDAPPSGL